jgi:hypothetical protein
MGAGRGYAVSAGSAAKPEALSAIDPSLGIGSNLITRGEDVDVDRKAQALRSPSRIVRRTSLSLRSTLARIGLDCQEKRLTFDFVDRS